MIYLFLNFTGSVTKKCRSVDNEFASITNNNEPHNLIERQQSLSTTSSAAISPHILMSTPSPARSSITPDTTKEGLEDNEEIEETIAVNGHDGDDGDAEIAAENESTDESSIPKQLPCSSGTITKDGITVELVGQHLWKKFYKLGTEMIITKAGR